MSFSIPINGARCFSINEATKPISHVGNETFPGWGQNIPIVGKYFALLLTIVLSLV